MLEIDKPMTSVIYLDILHIILVDFGRVNKFHLRHQHLTHMDQGECIGGYACLV